MPAGIAWVFPAGRFSRIGVSSYRGETHLGEILDRFLDSLGQERGEIHGGYLPNRLRDPVVGDVFLVGDAAGQCLAVSGEGIRPALFFGTILGRILGRVLEDELSVREAQKAYRREAATWKLPWNMLHKIQDLYPRIPAPLARSVMALISHPTVLRLWLGRFQRAMSSDLLRRAGTRGIAA